MNREQIDATVEIPPLDSESDNHVIRSHRMPRDYSVLRGLSAMAVAAAAVATLSTSVVTGVTQPTPQVPETPSVALTGPDGPSTADDETTMRTIERASRQRETRSETKPPPVVTPTPQVSRTEKIIGYAMAQLGKPYRWAQSGPRGFDCSGLLVAAFRTVGVSLYHYTGEIVKRGTRVARSALQRGDVVFPTVGHVGIYLGNGQMIHSSSSKGKVVIGKVYAFYAARRI